MSMHPPLPDGRQRADTAFRARFGVDPQLMVRVPGRVNLLGEPAGEADGCRLALATEQAHWLALRPRQDGLVILHDADRAETVEFSALAPERQAASWRELVKGVAWSLREAGWPLAGWEGCMASDLPAGIGLGSNAARAVAVARAFAECIHQPWDHLSAASLCAHASAEWGGGTVSLLDGLAVTAAAAGKALLLDPRTQSCTPVALPANYAWILLVSEGAVDEKVAALAERVVQCRIAAQRLGTPSLRDLTLTQFAQQARTLDDPIRSRVRHVVTENERVVRAVQAMEQGDGDGLGILLNMSHASLRDDFQVSNPQMDRLAGVTVSFQGCAGARVFGRNHGVVALIARWALSTLVSYLGPAIQAQTGVSARIIPTSPSAGVSLT